MSALDGLGTAMGIAGGAMRGYEGSQGRGATGPGNAPGQGPLMQYLRRRQMQPKRPFDMNSVYNAKPDMSAAQQQMPDLGSFPMPQQGVPGMDGMGIPAEPPRPPQAPQGMYPPQNPYAPNSTGTGTQQFAQGGVIDKPTTAIIGEDGPEMVVPLTDRPDARVSRANLQMQYRR